MKDAEKRNHYLKMVEEYDDILRYIDSSPSEPVSEALWEASKQYALRQVLASTDTEMSEQAYLSLRLFSGFELAVAHKDGAKWQKEQMMKDAVEVKVKVDAGGYPYVDRVIELYDYEKDIPLAKKGDKYKVILIKED